MSERNLGRQFGNVFSLGASKMAGRAVRAETPDFAAHADEAMKMGNSGKAPKKKSMYGKFLDLIQLNSPE